MHAAIVALVVTTLLAQPVQLVFYGAEITSSGIVAYGRAEPGGMPFLIFLNTAKREVTYAALIDAGVSGAILDAIQVGEKEFVATGFTERGRRVRATLLLKLSDEYVEWGYEASSGISDIGKAVSRLSDGYVVAGITRVPEGGETDVLLIYLSDGGEIVKAQRFGAPLYNDFVEKAGRDERQAVLIGATWSHNVSFSDALVITLGSRGVAAITVGGPSQDEGFAVLNVNGRLIVAGSTYGSEGGLSDGFLAFLNDSLAVSAIGWQGYDGFIDLCWEEKSLYALGYMVFRGRQMGILLKLSEDGKADAVAIVCESDLTPMAIGFQRGRLVAVMEYEDSLVIFEFDKDLEPLSAYTVGLRKPKLEKVRVLKITNLREHMWNITTSWRVKRLGVEPSPASLSLKKLRGRVTSLNLTMKFVEIEEGFFEGKPPLSELILRTIEQILPALVLIIPVVVILTAIVVLRRKGPASSGTGGT